MVGWLGGREGESGEVSLSSRWIDLVDIRYEKCTA